jgi:hypothetical protein
MRPTLFALMIAAFVAGGCAPARSPAQPAVTQSQRIVRIGEAARIAGVAVTSLAVLEDSRCPRDVTCVWAGRVVIRARIEAKGASSTMEMELGKPVTTAAKEAIVLAEVRPERTSSAAIEPADYRFVFAPAE